LVVHEFEEFAEYFLGGIIHVGDFIFWDILFLLIFSRGKSIFKPAALCFRSLVDSKLGRSKCDK
jgi:hypothetical protein